MFTMNYNHIHIPIRQSGAASLGIIYNKLISTSGANKIYFRGGGLFINENIFCPVTQLSRGYFGYLEIPSIPC